jgi:pyrroloquinoline quinone biosynthesis protein B
VVSEGKAIKIIILGTAQDGGVPHLACRCPRCGLARIDASFARTVASLGIINQGTGKVFLVDATPDIKAQLERLTSDTDYPDRPARSPLDGVLLTHAHIGHYTGLIHFGREVLATDHLPLYCTPRMARFLETNGPWSQLVELGQVVTKELVTGESYRLDDGLEIMPLPVPHRDEYSDTVGYLVEGSRKKLLYIPDIDSWGKWDRSLPDIVREVDIALLDGTFYSRDELPRNLSEVPHPPVEETLGLLDGTSLKGKKICFTHFNHSNPVLNRDGRLKSELEEKGVLCADEGMTFRL